MYGRRKNARLVSNAIPSSAATTVAAGATNKMLVRCADTQEMLIARLCHPSRAGEMALPGPFCPVRLPLGIDVKHDTGDFAPIRPFGFRIEQPQIGHEVLFIIPCQNGIAWSAVRNRWIKRRCHVAVPASADN